MKTKEIHLILLHTVQLNETGGDIYLCGRSYQEDESVEICVVFNDMSFLECISHNEIDKIKNNLKKRIDNL